MKSGRALLLVIGLAAAWAVLTVAIWFGAGVVSTAFFARAGHPVHLWFDTFTMVLGWVSFGLYLLVTALTLRKMLR
ncbi:hypothetical protein JMG10_13075 [Nostoc ellipsosporum NOK]|uniref:hypothetical protein n=1 Tax=Sphingomonas sp. IBVSS2 TaxID=1985172 RepID=UPI000A2E218D|nr:hypothetical protein [Sphingomonas sp. IBVSS2]MDF2382408.1 hypothetical protein [Nostoc ellipsosporum NOK]OSZ66360.1 hypothetical protein CAP40_10720 [Sphingomonas sp. IBVSS2]